MAAGLATLCVARPRVLCAQAARGRLCQTEEGGGHEEERVGQKMGRLNDSAGNKPCAGRRRRNRAGGHETQQQGGRARRRRGLVVQCGLDGNLECFRIPRLECRSGPQSVLTDARDTKSVLRYTQLYE